MCAETGKKSSTFHVYFSHSAHVPLCRAHENAHPYYGARTIYLPIVCARNYDAQQLICAPPPIAHNCAARARFKWCGNCAVVRHIIHTQRAQCRGEPRRNRRARALSNRRRCASVLRSPAVSVTHIRRSRSRIVCGVCDAAASHTPSQLGVGAVRGARQIYCRRGLCAVDLCCVQHSLLSLVVVVCTTSRTRFPTHRHRAPNIDSPIRNVHEGTYKNAAAVI